MNRFGSGYEHGKLLKVINMSKKAEETVSDNIYGYTGVFSNRPAKLEAIAKDFTSTYSVDKDDILFCIHQNSKDF
ncbi:MAG: hypothetical protein KDD45_07290 [Bdellovibrionales bacterium]|nr:hypothetical protein [Bdellovibrionales bacterium]